MTKSSPWNVSLPRHIVCLHKRNLQCRTIYLRRPNFNTNNSKKKRYGLKGACLFQAQFHLFIMKDFRKTKHNWPCLFQLCDRVLKSPPPPVFDGSLINLNLLENYYFRLWLSHYHSYTLDHKKCTLLLCYKKTPVWDICYFETL